MGLIYYRKLVPLHILKYTLALGFNFVASCGAPKYAIYLEVARTFSRKSQSRAGYNLTPSYTVSLKLVISVAIWTSKQLLLWYKSTSDRHGKLFRIRENAAPFLDIVGPHLECKLKTFILGTSLNTFFKIELDE